MSRTVGVREVGEFGGGVGLRSDPTSACHFFSQTYGAIKPQTR